MKAIERQEKNIFKFKLLILGSALMAQISRVHRSDEIIQIISALVICVVFCTLKHYHRKFFEGHQGLLEFLNFILMYLLLSIVGYNSLLAIILPIFIVLETHNTITRIQKMKKIVLLVYVASFLTYVLTRKTQLIDVFYFLSLGVLIYATTSVAIRVYLDSVGYRQELALSNELLDRRVAELSNLQKMQRGMKSTVSTYELINTVNDMIIGIIGPTYSSIVISNYKRSKEYNGKYLLVTNIEESRRSDFIEIDYKEIAKLDIGDGIIRTAEDMGFFDKKVSTFMAVPIEIKEGCVGMIIVYHYLDNAFNDEHLRFMKLMAQDFVISLENTGIFEEAESRAHLDGLTNVYNRMYFQEALKGEFKKVIQNGYSLSIIIGDIDQFKMINDRYGHVVGDHVLKVIVERIKDNIRSKDILSRYGGEEFVIILPKCYLKEATMIAERIRIAISDTPIKFNNQLIGVTMSFGIASYPDHAITEDELLMAADKALYYAKGQGKNCIRIAGSEEYY